MDIEKEFYDLKLAIEEVGKVAYAYFDSSDTSYEQKLDNTVVTEVDKNVEAFLLGYIKEHFPNDTIVGEEYGETTGTSGFVWYIDPIDGTDNFLRKVPFSAISVARLGDSVEDSFGIVYNPITRQMFSSLAESEGGVYENERVCHLTADSLGGRYVIAIGRGRKEPWMKSAGYALSEGLGMKFGKCKAFDCTALELSYVASNRFDGFLTYGLKPYDYAAGLFLTKAAGAAISIYENGEWRLWTQNLKELCAIQDRTIFVSHRDTHQDFIEFIGDPKLWAKE